MLDSKEPTVADVATDGTSSNYASGTLNEYRRLVMMAGIASVATGGSFVVMKLVVWFMSGSSTMFASFTDSMFDSLASVLNLITLHFSMRAADREHRFGHFKAQSLASLAQAAFIGGSAVLLIMHGIDRWQNPQEIGHALTAIAVSVGTVLVTLILISFQAYVYSKTKSELVYADRFHYISDICLNVGVVAALCLAYWGYLWADGMFAVLIGLFILHGAWKIGMDAANTLIDKSLDPVDNQRIMKAVLETEGVKSLHDLKTRKAGPEYYIQCHLVLDGEQSLAQAHRTADLCESHLRAIYPDADISLHMEPDTPDVNRDGLIYDEDLQIEIA